MSGMRAHIVSRLRSSSLSAVPPRPDQREFSVDLAKAAESILYRSPIPSTENRPVYILNAAALPDSREADYDSLLPYVLARLPEEDELLRGFEYEVVFFAGDSDGSPTTKKNRPGWGWFLQAYHVLSRAMRKRLQKLYIVHEKAWVRILSEIFSTIVSPKFRRKIIHASTLTNLAFHLRIEDLIIPPSAYLHDRRISDDIFAPYASGRRAFCTRQPFPVAAEGKTRLPRVLRETSSFLMMEQNIVAEGLFRVPPHSKLRDVLKEAFDRGQKFIIWKDNGATLPIPPYPRAEHMDEILAEIDAKDAYSVFMAAALIKAWYADLRQPIFPPGSYRDLKRLYGDVDDVPSVERLTELLSPSSEWSFLPAISREIIVRHLLPLLSAVAAHEEHNKMPPENLAVCFAPALLCGPDQLEDAKMSSIIRRVITAAIELWGQGLREACGEKEATFLQELRLPTNQSDWDDPVEGRKGRPDEGSMDEQQRTGIILQDNEQPSMPAPPLPPRTLYPHGQSRQASGHSINDTMTKRKPAPPLQVPPRYSTIVNDSPRDETESPTNYAAVTDGFAPPRPTEWDSLDEKKSGTNLCGDPHAPPQIVVPKRKALTAEQIDNAEYAATQIQSRKGSASSGGISLPGLTELQITEPVTRKAGPPTTYLAYANHRAPPTYAQSETASPISAASDSSSSAPGNEFRRPSWPASANRTPNITSLARPVFPPPTAAAAANLTGSKSASLPIPGPKPRTPSPSLLKRMPSLGASKSPEPLAPPSGARRLNTKKASVDNLRRLYEERAGTAKTLIETARRK
ncbi:divergent CRAL/TRIO domain-containing protein [Massariosphaeria phaeospora]|uniref:Divergent CRAL/TRIO domain-containing protein n=1 Tax=Massariosphaeria phaeospora TaxID=100035 RepID=A0A7C8M9K5_9PLEO|nr:divergent CRAL/TRIO domain-containing protein [Massariosphaeria phaeospora]